MSDPQPALPPPEGADEGPFWGYRDVLVFFGAALPLLIVAMFLSTAAIHAVARFTGSTPPKAVLLLPGQFLFYLLWFLFLCGWIKLRYGRPFWLSMAWFLPAGGAGISFVLGLLTAVVSIVIGSLLPSKQNTPMLQLLSDPLSIAMVGFFALSLGPLCEELAFRGFLLPLLVRSLGAVGGIALNAILFSLLHGQEYGWSLGSMAAVGIAGAAFAYMRFRSGSTANATIMHASYNLVAFIGFLAQRGIG